MTNVYTIVWNEEFILPDFLLHYEKYADKIFIVDDHSTDATKYIATSHPKVTYIPYGFEGLNEDEFNDTFYSLYKNNPSDWAIVADADEFIQGLEGLEFQSKGVLETKGYMMIGKTGRLEDCKKVRMKTFDKPVVFDPSLDVRFGDGRHTVNLPTQESDLELWHYKYPSREYYEERNKLAYPRIMDEKDTRYRLKRGLAWYDANI